MINNSFLILDDHYQELKDGGQDIIKGLTTVSKYLPSRFFYDDRGSQLFEKICELPEYYPTRTETWILSQYAEEIAKTTGSCSLVELGSGSSTKTRILLDAYQENPHHCNYIPIDISDSILKNSVLQLQKEYPDFEICGLLGTYDQALVYLASRTVPQMVFFLGSSMGNFNQGESDIFFNKVSCTLKPGDYFLLGIDLQKSPDILESAYNDSQGVTVDFNLNILSHLNWRFQGNFDLSLFKHRAIYNQIDTQIEMYLDCQASHSVNLDILDLQVSFESGETIFTEISHKFNVETIQKQLITHNLQPIKVWTDPQQWFALVLSQA